MATYYLHLHEGEAIIEADESEDFANIDIAKVAAIKAAREIMCADVAEGRLCLSSYIAIADAKHVEVARVQFGDAVRVSGL